MARQLCDKRAEAALVGAALQEPVLFLNGVQPCDFCDSSLEKLWDTGAALACKGITPDSVTFPDNVLPTGKTRQDLVNACPDVGNATAYAKIVRDLASRRTMMAAAQAYAEASRADDDLERAKLLAQARALAQEATAPDGWRLRTLANAYSDRDPVEYAVKGLFERSSLSIVYGAPGTLKSMLLADMAVCVAAGLPWLADRLVELSDAPSEQEIDSDRPGEVFSFLGPMNKDGLPEGNGGRGFRSKETSQMPVFWLDFDNGRRRTDERFDALAKSRGLPADTELYYITMPDPWVFANELESIDRLIRQAEAIGAGVIVVDNLGVITDCDENSADMALAMSGLRRLAEETSAAVIVIHHQRKSTGTNARLGESLRGHSSIEASLDLALLVRRDAADNELAEIVCTKSRGIDVSTFGARFKYTHRRGTKELSSAFFTGEAIESKTSRVKKAVLRIVDAQPGINKTELLEAIRQETGAGINSTRSAVDQMTENNQIAVERGAHNAKRYLPITSARRA